MFFSEMPLMSMMVGKLSWLSERGEILAENVANADTPKYRARDLAEISFSQELTRERRGGAGQPRRTNERHLEGSKPVRAFAIEDRPDNTESKLNGNTVGIEQQLISVGETQSAYQFTINLYRKHMDMLRTAIGRAG